MNIEQINKHLDSIEIIVNNLNVSTQPKEIFEQTITINQPQSISHVKKTNSPEHDIYKHDEDVDLSLMDLNNKYSKHLSHEH